MAVLLVHPYLQFLDDDGNPLAGGKVYTYASGTTTPKATYTDSTGATPAANPVVLDAAGRATMWGTGAYKFIVKDADDNTIRTTDGVSSFNVVDPGADSFFQSFSGNGTNTSFTLSDDLGTDEKAIMVFIDSGLNNHATNGTFDSDTGWIKGTGWTIGSGVATATGAISTAIEQDAGITLVQGQSYNITVTVTRSAGSITPNIGGTAGTARSSSATFTETIIAGSTQKITFNTSGFTGTIDNVMVTKAVGNGLQVINPSAYTVDGTDLEFSAAPPSGTNNIFVFAPSLLVGAAASAASEAGVHAANAAESAALAVSAAGYSYTYSTTTTAADPGAGFLRFNNASLASATALYISETTGDAQAIAADIATWDDGTSVIRGRIRVFKQTDTSVFAIFNVTGSNTDKGSWDTLTISYVGGFGSLADDDDVTIQFISNGDKGDVGSPGNAFPVIAAGGTVNAITADFMPDVSLSDTVLLGVISSGPNTSTTPTFSPDGATARTIVKKGGVALSLGDTGAAGNVMLLEYNLANTRWELLNPAKTTQADIVGLGFVNDFRLTLNSGTPVTTSDVTGATTIYCAPYKGNRIALYDGTQWNVMASAEFSVALGTITNDRMYDVFCYDNAGTPTLEILAWTNNTTRATALAYQDGVLVKSGDATRRYVGSFCTTSTTTTEDSIANRFLWNYYNRISRSMRRTESTDTWTYTTATVRQANGSTSNQLNFIIGVSEDVVSANVYATARNSTALIEFLVGIGLDSTTAFHASCINTRGMSNAVNGSNLAIASLDTVVAEGKHYLSWLEVSAATGTTTWFGDNGSPTTLFSGITGKLLA